MPTQNWKLEIARPSKPWRSWGNWKLKRGFTLIELLIVIGILTVIVSAALYILTAALKGANQANVTLEVKQNGQGVLDSLERQIRNAQSAQLSTVLPPGASNHLILTISGTNTLHIACFTTTATTNGWIGVGQDPGTSVANYTPITNQNSISGVDVSVCNLNVIQASTGSGKPSVVSISLNLNQGVNAPSRKDFLASAPFQTTISLRNY